MMGWLERAISLVGLVGSILGGYIYVESNFASAADLKRVEAGFRDSVQELRQKTMEDKVFELEFKQASKPKDFEAIDRALLERYKRELKDIRQTRSQGPN